MIQPNSFSLKNQSFKLLPTPFYLHVHNITTPRLIPMRMSNAASHKRSTKGPHIREDDCPLPVYLSLLVYG